MLPNKAISSVIGRITTSGRFQSGKDKGIANEQFAYGIAPGPDGKMWFALNAQIANISMTGKITAVPTAESVHPYRTHRRAERYRSSSPHRARARS